MSEDLHHHRDQHEIVELDRFPREDLGPLLRNRFLKWNAENGFDMFSLAGRPFDRVFDMDSPVMFLVLHLESCWRSFCGDEKGRDILGSPQ
jgi:hypothetical protein